MSNRLFQSVIYQMKDAFDRVIGVIDENDVVISCSDLGKMGEIRQGIKDELSFSSEFMPVNGYTPMFENMLDHESITVSTGTDARERVKFTEDGSVLLDGESFDGLVIFSGAIDELFDYKYGDLPYRTLDFGFETLDVDSFQPDGTVNYTVDMPFTRITEFKKLTGQKMENKTTIMREYSRACTRGDNPYYAILNEENLALYGKYRTLAEKSKGLHLVGRLAEYRYYNMDAIVARALELCDSLI